MYLKKKKGFSYMEVIFIIVVLGILTTIAFTYYKGFKPNAELSAKQLEASTITNAISEYIQMYGKAPTAVNSVDYSVKPALLDISKIRSDLSNNKITGNFYILGANNQIFYDYPPSYIKERFDKYQIDKGTQPFITGTKEIDVQKLYTQGYIDIAPITSFVINDDGTIKQIPLVNKVVATGSDTSLNGSTQPTTPIITASKSLPYYANDTILFTATSSYQKGAVTVVISGETANHKYSVGSHTVTAIATGDDGTISTVGTLTFNVINLNGAPNAPNVTITPYSATNTYLSTDVITFAATTTDPENDAVTFKWMGLSSTNKYVRGQHTVSVYAVDAVGNISTTTSVTFTVANSPPTILSVTPSITPIYFDQVVTFTATISDIDGDLSDYNIVSGQTPNNKYPVGQNTIQIVAKDSYGASSAVFNYTFTSFNKPISDPTIVMTPDSTTDIRTNTSISFASTGSVDPVGVGFQYKWTVDGGTLQTTVPNAKYSIGIHTVTVQAFGATGNMSGIVTKTFTVNNTLPTTPLLSMAPLANTDIRSYTNIVFLANGSTDIDPGDTVSYEWNTDNSGWGTTQPDGTFNVGNHIILVRAKDTNGGITPSVSISFMVNNTAPTKPSIVMSPDPITDIRSNTVITFTRMDSTDIDNDVLTYKWTIDGGTTTTTAPSGTYTVGNHTVTLLAIDSHGASSAVDTLNFTVNNTAPTDPKISVTPSITSDNRSYTIMTFTNSLSTDLDGDAITIEWNKDNSGWSTTKPNGTFSIGAHTVQLRATDSRGAKSNIDHVDFTINNTAPNQPTVSMTPPSNSDLRSNTNISFSANASDADGDTITIEWNPDNLGWTTTVPTNTYSIGNHVIRVRAKDPLNALSTENVISFTVNNTAPTQPTISMTPIGTSDLRSNTNITFQSTSTDVDNDAITYEWNVDNSIWTSTVPNGTYAVGDHTIQVRSKDVRGAYSLINSITFTINNTAPNQPILTMDASPDQIKSNTVITFTAISSDIDGDSVSYQWSKDGSIWSNTKPDGKFNIGGHSIQVRSFDSRGAFSVITELTFDVKNTAPTDPKIIMTPGQNATAETTIKFDTTSVTDIDGDSITINWSVDYGGWTSVKPDGLFTFGYHTIQVQATDSRGASSNIDQIRFYVTADTASISNFTNSQAVSTRYRNSYDPENTGVTMGQVIATNNITNLSYIVSAHPTDPSKLRVTLNSKLSLQVEDALSNTMVFYDKYNAVGTIVDTFFPSNPPTMASYPITSHGGSSANTASSGYAYDATTHMYQLWQSTIVPGSTMYWGSNNGGSFFTSITKFDNAQPDSGGGYAYIYGLVTGQRAPSTNYSKGTLVQSNIIAADGTYPNDGIHTDGYWYVKRVNSPLNYNLYNAHSFNINGVDINYTSYPQYDQVKQILNYDYTNYVIDIPKPADNIVTATITANGNVNDPSVNNFRLFTDTPYPTVTKTISVTFNPQ
jgi:type II secretory pathway pseudopilin PulG